MIVSQTLALILLMIYLAAGINRLVKLWPIITFYQAVVLILVLSFQFMVNSPGYEGSFLEKKYNDLPDKTKVILEWFGFEKYEDPIWR